MSGGTFWSKNDEKELSELEDAVDSLKTKRKSARDLLRHHLIHDGVFLTEVDTHKATVVAEALFLYPDEIFDILTKYRIDKLR